MQASSSTFRRAQTKGKQKMPLTSQTFISNLSEDIDDVQDITYSSVRTNKKHVTRPYLQPPPLPGPTDSFPMHTPPRTPHCTKLLHIDDHARSPTPKSFIQTITQAAEVNNSVEVWVFSTPCLFWSKYRARQTFHIPKTKTMIYHLITLVLIYHQEFMNQLCSLSRTRSLRFPLTHLTQLWLPNCVTDTIRSYCHTTLHCNRRHISATPRDAETLVPFIAASAALNQVCTVENASSVDTKICLFTESSSGIPWRSAIPQ